MVLYKALIGDLEGESVPLCAWAGEQPPTTGVSPGYAWFAVKRIDHAGWFVIRGLRRICDESYGKLRSGLSYSALR